MNESVKKNDTNLEYKPILCRQKIYEAYYPLPETNIIRIIQRLLEENGMPKGSWYITTKIWHLLVDEIGLPINRSTKKVG